MTETTIRIEISHDKPLPPDLFFLLEKFPAVFVGEEVWATHPQYAEYEFSSEGRVRRKPGTVVRKDGSRQRVRGGEILPGSMGDGYQHWTASVGGVQTSKSLHRSVLDSFFGPQPEKVGCHLNGVRGDNRLLNLRWGTQKENEADKVRHGTAQRGERHGGSKLTEAQVAAMRADCRPYSAIAADYGISSNHARKIKAGLAWKHSAQGCEVGVRASLVPESKEAWEKGE